MVFDMQVPKGNESKLIEESVRLGINRVIFLYRAGTKKELVSKKGSNEKLSKKYEIQIYTGLLLRPEKTTDVSRFPKSVYFEADFIAAEAKDEKLVRAIVSQGKVDLLVNPEAHRGKDHTHYRYSGINQVLARLARDNGLSYGIDFHRLLKLKPNQRVKLLGRIMQNIRIFQKYKVPLAIGSFASNPEGIRNSEDLAALLRVLGSTHTNSKAAIKGSIERILTRKQERRSPDYVRPGVRVVN